MSWGLSRAKQIKTQKCVPSPRSDIVGALHNGHPPPQSHFVANRTCVLFRYQAVVFQGPVTSAPFQRTVLVIQNNSIYLLEIGFEQDLSLNSVQWDNSTHLLGRMFQGKCLSLEQKHKKETAPFGLWRVVYAGVMPGDRAVSVTMKKVG